MAVSLYLILNTDLQNILVSRRRNESILSPAGDPTAVAGENIAGSGQADRRYMGAGAVYNTM